MEGGGSVCVRKRQSGVSEGNNHCESSWGGGEYEEGRAREMELEIISCNQPVHLPTALY